MTAFVLKLFDCTLLQKMGSLRGVMRGNTRKYLNRIAAFIVALMIGLVVAGSAMTIAYAEGEENASSDYEPTEHRHNNKEINEWEDKVLIAATDKLTSEGRVYYAYADYVDELISYFSKKDLNLSKDEAQDAINKIKDPANAKSGARSGYLYQIGGSPKEEGSIIEESEYDGQIYPEFKEDVRFKNETEYRQSDLYKNNKAYIEDRSNTVYESKAAMREEMKELAAADRKFISFLKDKPSGESIDDLVASKGLGIGLLVVSALALLMTIGVIAYGWRNKTVSALLGLDDESWNRGNTHRDRHRIRKISAIILALVVAFDLVVICSGLTYRVTFGSDSYIEEAMDEGGICQHGYMSFRDEVHEYLSSKSLPQNSLDLALAYRGYRFDYIKGTRSAMKKGEIDVVYKGIQESVESQVDLMAYMTKQDSSSVIESINEIYEKSMSTDVGIFINKLRASLNRSYAIAFVLCIASLLLASLMTIFERHDVYRGLRDLSIGTLAGSAIWGVITAYFKLMKDDANIAISSDSAYVTYSMAMDGIGRYMLILLGLSLVASLLLFGASMYMQRRL